MKIYGTNSETNASALNLKEYLKVNQGVHPEMSLIKRIFVPNKYQTFTFVTDHNFKVSIRDTSPLFAKFMDDIEMMAAHSLVLKVRIIDSKTLKWQLVEDEDSRIEWSEDDYGWVCNNVQSRSAEKPAIIETKRKSKKQLDIDLSVS